MMRFGKLLAATAALGLAAAPAMAAPANSAATLSIGNSARAGAPVAHRNKALSGGILIAVIAAAAVIAGVVAIATNSSSTPASR